jgi:hypothetical protein
MKISEISIFKSTSSLEPKEVKKSRTSTCSFSYTNSLPADTITWLLAYAESGKLKTTLYPDELSFYTRGLKKLHKDVLVAWSRCGNSKEVAKRFNLCYSAICQIRQRNLTSIVNRIIEDAKKTNELFTCDLSTRSALLLFKAGYRSLDQISGDYDLLVTYFMKDKRTYKELKDLHKGGII